MADHRNVIVQFGTSRFLQAHVDLFASEAAAAGQAVPPIVVVQTTRDPSRAGRAAAFGAVEGYPVRIRGRGADGALIERETRVRSIVRGLHAADDWTDLCAMFERSATYVVSNTGDAGYRVAEDDRVSTLLQTDEPPRSFPAMLLVLLHRRWRSGEAPVTLMPCELVQGNGDTLKAVVTDLAQSVGAEQSFLAWLDDDCLWVNSLVDRIVSEPIDPVGAVAEPYALWAVADQPGLVMPFTHPDVVLTDDLARYERLKLYILNLGHSWLAQRWIDSGRPEGRFVRDAVADAATRSALMRVYAEEVVPGFAAHGMADSARIYVAETMARFANPFLDHRLADIADHHPDKLRKRIGGFLSWVDSAATAPPLPELDAIMSRADVPVA